MKDLWSSCDAAEWQRVLEQYDAVIAAQGVARLPALDGWYHQELPPLFEERTPPYITLPELVKVTEWKMARGVWRARNLVLVRGNDEHAVIQFSTEAFNMASDLKAAIAKMSELQGVGPATASAVLAAVHPETYPFFDELVAAQLSELEQVTFTLSYYTRYTAALCQRAFSLGETWTPARVERALWANSGGKAANKKVN